MPNRPGSDDRNTAGGLGDRSGQRDDSGRATGGGGTPTQTRTRSNRGFASMDREKQKEIASKGGKAAHAKGTAHEFDSSEAREAGRKGGVAVSRNREHMAAIGRRGGEARGHSRSRATAQTNTGSAESTSGSFQNTQRPTAGGDRQVPLSNQSEGVSANTQGTRGGTSSLGGERRPGGLDNNSSRSEGYGNH
ncbi:MAG TPA: KGG domain-containing protein [Gemmatimonadaceae bacterium]